MRTIPVRQHTRSIADKPGILGNETHRRLKNEVALMNLDRNLSAELDALFAELAKTDDGREQAEQIRMSF